MRVLWAHDGNDNDPHGIALHISEEDAENYVALPPGNTGATIIVFDFITARHYTVRRDACGAECYCAARADRVK